MIHKTLLLPSSSSSSSSSSLHEGFNKSSCLGTRLPDKFQPLHYKSSSFTIVATMADIPPHRIFSSPVVSVAYSDLQDKNADISPELEAGFGSMGLGILAVSGVPRYTSLRQQLLSLAERLATLPEPVRRRLEDPDSRYSFGWSHGKETLESGQPDVLKGSFYANPLLDKPTCSEELMQRYPSYCRPNLWPTTYLPELEQAFKDLGKLIIDVGLLLSYHCDKYVSLKDPHNDRGSLQEILQSSLCHKGRLLHYFASSERCTSEKISSWCGWHTDHGSLTGLTCAMYMKDSNEIVCPDTNAGLYVKTRSGEIVKASFKDDQIAYQMGEATEFMSNGLFHATPHCVRAAAGVDAAGVVRNTFAVFMQPHWDQPLQIGNKNYDCHDKVEVESTGYLSFGDFSEDTLAKYYKDRLK